MLRFLQPAPATAPVLGSAWLLGTRASFNQLPPRLGQPCSWPSLHHCASEERSYHSACDKKEKEKGSAAKKKHEEGSCPPRYRERPHKTLRPEDVAAAANTGARPLPPPADAKMHADKERMAAAPCPPPPPRTPPPPTATKKTMPTRPAQTPQPTHTLLPRNAVGGASLPPQHNQDAIAGHSRPVITRIRMCTPQEVRKFFEPEPLVCPPPSEPLSLKQTLGNMVLFSIKGAIAAFVVWITVDLGIWESSERTTELLSIIRNGEPYFPAPHAADVMYNIKNMWNRAVINTFWLLLHFPENVQRMWGNINKDKEEVHSPPETGIAH